MPNSVYNEPHIIWMAIITLFQFAQKYAAALKAYGNVYKDDGAQNAAGRVDDPADMPQVP